MAAETTPTAPRWVEWVPLDKILEAEDNPKGHAQATIEQSFSVHGYVAPVVRDERTGRLVAGHGRLAELRRARDVDATKPPDGVMLDETRGWLVGVWCGWRSVDDDQAAAYLLVDNVASELGGWRRPALADMVGGLRDRGRLEGSGYTRQSADEILALAGRANAEDDQQDQADEPPPADPVTKPGDVWLLGPHRVMCGDCRNVDDVATLLAGQQVQLAFTSPPYADRRDYDDTSEFRPVKPDDYVEWFEPIAAAVAKHLADDGSWVLNIKEGCDDGVRQMYVVDLLLAHVRQWGWRWVDEFCWRDTNNGIPGAWPNRVKDAWERVFHFTRSSDVKFRPMANATDTTGAFVYSASNTKSATGSGLLGQIAGTRGEGLARPSNVVEIGAAGVEAGVHPAQFPIHLPAWFTRLLTDSGDVVFDPFIGSGTTLIAAHQFGRIGCGMDVSRGYVDVVCARWQRVTGIEPVLEATGETRSFTPVV